MPKTTTTFEAVQLAPLTTVTRCQMRTLAMARTLKIPHDPETAAHRFILAAAVRQALWG